MVALQVNFTICLLWRPKFDGSGTGVVHQPASRAPSLECLIVISWQSRTITKRATLVPAGGKGGAEEKLFGTRQSSTWRYEAPFFRVSTKLTSQADGAQEMALMVTWAAPLPAARALTNFDCVNVNIITFKTFRTRFQSFEIIPHEFLCQLEEYAN